MPETKDDLRHSAAHLLAAAVLDLWPGALRAIGPSIKDGFYYDFEFPHPISDADLPKIEERMRALLPAWKEFTKKTVGKDEALALFPGNPYKRELVEEFSRGGAELTIYQSGGYSDLCKGGHITSPDKTILHFKLLSVAGAYWRGDEKNTMLTRIYGTAFPSAEELGAYLARRESAKERDHRKLGRELDLFVFSPLVGGGLPLFTPKGTILRNTLDDFVWELRRERGYERVDIPHLTRKELYEKSGHWDKFKTELFTITTREKHVLALKPMNCPHHIQIYARKQWSYRELPVRYASTTKVYRDEQTGELSGLARVRAFTQDDAHVFCRSGDVKREIESVWDIVESFYGASGFPLSVRLSLHDPKSPEKYLGSAETWSDAEEKLREIVKERGVEAVLGVGEANFYGPKIDFMSTDSLGREWQVATIQLDMNLPERFDLSCVNEGGKAERIVMIHAAIMGSIERYLSILIEHFGGAFPLWLSPVHVKVLTIGSTQTSYATEVHKKLLGAGIRSELDTTDETLNKKIRNAKLEKVPYFLVLGGRERESGTVTVESREGKKSQSLAPETLITSLLKEIREKKN